MIHAALHGYVEAAIGADAFVRGSQIVQTLIPVLCPFEILATGTWIAPEECSSGVSDLRCESGWFWLLRNWNQIFTPFCLAKYSHRGQNSSSGSVSVSCLCISLIVSGVGFSSARIAFARSKAVSA